MPVDTTQYNINLETVENCNLLCKLIIDYLPSENCTIEKKSGESFRINYPKGSFINYKDTSYELTHAYFFYPSRHSIDGQKYDLEVNIYHGKFDGEGMVLHTQYHNDTEDSYQHKHFHYHLPDDDINNEPHSDDGQNLGNIVTCLLFNKGEHKGTDLNIFFNQFVHHKDFKNMKGDSSPKIIKVHDNWTIEQIYPKKRSFFIYDSQEGDKNTYVVFDTVQTISKEIIDRLYIRGIKGGKMYDLTAEPSFNIENPSRVMYRKNIEVITDPTYKKTKRAQIKDLLSLTRMSTYKPTKRTTKEYNTLGNIIVNSYTNGDNVGFFYDENKAKSISNLWDTYAKDVPEKKLIEDFSNAKEILLNSETVTNNKNLDSLVNEFKDKFGSLDVFNDEYLKRRKELNNSFENFYSKEVNPDVYYSFFDNNNLDNNNLDNNNLFKNMKDSGEQGVLLDFLAENISRENQFLGRLRVLFEDMDTEWKKKNNIQTNIYETLTNLYYNNPDNLKNATPTISDLFKERNFLSEKKIYFSGEGKTLNRTISNEECQHWLSNEKHYEGDLWKFWEKNRQIGKDESFDWSKLPYLEKEKIKEGLIRFDETTTKWKTHNQCRNPGNNALAPWCYTKNPNKRWEYCKNPVYSNKLGKFILFLVFIFLAVIAYFTIKVLFLHEYPTKFVEKVTGGKMASQEVFQGAQPPGPNKPVGSPPSVPKPK